MMIGVKKEKKKEERGRKKDERGGKAKWGIKAKRQGIRHDRRQERS